MKTRKNKEEARWYREVYFKSKSRAKTKEGYLEGIQETQRPNQVSNLIEVSRWQNWDKSFWVKIQRFNSYVIVDSGVIEQLADEIRRLKKAKQPFKRDPLEKLIVINHTQEFY